MSEVENQLAILLPESSVTVFSDDKETIESAEALEVDWRFSRVDVQVNQGDISTATELYASQSSPDLIIIQTETIEEEFTSKLEGLAANCDEGTAAIIIGPVNDVYLYRRLIDMGVSDYLVRPVETPVLADVVGRTLIERIGLKDSNLIAFIGAKGGVGTSTLAQAYACGVSEILGQKTFLLDACGGRSTLSIGLGFEATTTLAEAVKAAVGENEDALSRMFHKVDDKLSVLASGGDVMLETSVDADDFESLLDVLMAKYPVVVVDLSQAAEEIQKIVLSKASQINVVSNQLVSSLRQARSLSQEIMELRGDDAIGIEFMLNMSGFAPKHEIPKGDIEKAMGLEISTSIAYEPSIFMGGEADSRRLTKDVAGKALLEKSIIPVARKIVGGDVKGGSVKEVETEGLLGGFLKKLSS